MYLKLSFCCLLIGLINQTIAAPSSSDKPKDSTEYLTSNYVSDEVINSAETTENRFSETTENPAMIHYMQVSGYIRRCMNRDNTTVFNIEDAHDHTAQAINSEESLSLDEITKEANAIFDDIVEKQNETYEFQERIRQATKELVSIISAAKKSELHEIVRVIAKASKKLMAVLMNDREGINAALLQSMNSKIVTATQLKDDFSTTTYYLDFLVDNIHMLDIFQESHEFNDAVERLTSSFERTEKHITEAQTPIDNELANASIDMLHKLTDEIVFISNTDMPDYFKFSGARCMIEDAVMGIFMRTFMKNFRSAIDPQDDPAS